MRQRIEAMREFWDSADWIGRVIMCALLFYFVAFYVIACLVTLGVIGAIYRDLVG